MRRLSILLTAVVTTLTMNSCIRKESVDLVVINSHVYTVDESFSSEESFAVRDGKIVATGTTDEILKKSTAREIIFTLDSTMHIVILTDMD